MSYPMYLVGQAVVKLSPLTHLHDDVERVLVLEKRLHRHDVRMCPRHFQHVHFLHHLQADTVKPAR